MKTSSQQSCMVILILIMFTACSSQTEREPKLTKSPLLNNSEEIVRTSALVSDTAFSLKYDTTVVAINIRTAKANYVGDVLLLHGWNLPHTEWCEKTALCDSLVQAGYNVIMPDFGKSTYQWEIYPETIERYKSYPTRKWMYESLLSFLQEKLKLLQPNNFNAVIGLSTGGRGAALFGLELPDIFDACVALSADFDQTKISDEPINNGFYGAYAEFPDRWEGRDNIYNRAEEWKVPVYLGHGTLDEMCPTEQTELFAQRLEELGFQSFELSLPEAKHDYDYWGSETDAILDFLRKIWMK